MSRDWADKEGPLGSDDDLDERVHQILDRLTRGGAVEVGQEGRREFERRAAAREHRADMVDASHEVSAAYFAPGGPAEAQAARERIDRARAQAAAQPARWAGHEHMTDDDRAAWEREAWPTHADDRQRADDHVLE